MGYIFDYMIHNRKLKIEEYDNTGNLIDTRELSKKDMFNFMVEQISNGKPLSVARSEDLNMFSKEELKLIQETMESDEKFYWFTKNEAKFIRELSDKTDISILKNVLNLIKPVLLGTYAFNTYNNSEYVFKTFTLDEFIKFIKSRDGIYYTIDNQGRRQYDFVDRPTKEQIQYHKLKNGNKTVFLSFKDWKEHIVE